MHTKFFFLIVPAAMAAAQVFMTPAALAATPALANTPADETAAPVRGLAPAQIAAIRAISRNVLAAKKSAVEDPTDAEQLGKLRTALDEALAAEVNPVNQTQATEQGAISSVPPRARAQAAARRETARADVQALVGQLRQRRDLLVSRADSGVTLEKDPMELSMVQQRARILTRLAQKLDAALALENAGRVAQLSELRGQLKATGGVFDASPILDTPTIQVKRATSVTPIRVVRAPNALPQSLPFKARPSKSRVQGTGANP